MTGNANPAETATAAEEKSNTKANPGGNSTNRKKLFKAKTIAGVFKILSFLLSLPIIASVIWLLYMKDYDCEKLLRLPTLRMGIGIGLIFVFLLSNLVVCLRSKFPIPGLLVIMVPLILMLTAGLSLIGGYKMESRTIPASPIWLRLKVYDDAKWYNIKSCIYYTGQCDDLVSRSLTMKTYDVSTRRLSSIESGCCKPPTLCDMVYVNATYWRKQDDGNQMDASYPYDSDCNSWHNNRNVLCYNCTACKEGFLRTLQGKWWKLGMFLVVMALLLILSHLLLFLATMWERYGG